MIKKILFLTLAGSLCLFPKIVSAKTVTRQLVKNSSFENKEYWTHDSSYWREKLFSAKKGIYYGTLYPDEGEGDSIEQVVRIPKNAKTATVSFWYRFESTDYEIVSDDFCAFDLESKYFSNGYIGYESWHPGEEENSSWEKFSFTFNPKKVKGKNILLSFYCYNDYSLNSWLDIDLVKLKVDVEK